MSAGTPRTAPHYSLREIHTLAHGGRSVRVGTTRALHPIIARLSCDRRQAVAFAIRVVLSLVEDDFAESVTLHDGTRADVYGLQTREGAWYVKLMITPRYPGRDDRLEVDILSCHPPRHDLRTRRGIIVAQPE